MSYICVCEEDILTGCQQGSHCKLLHAPFKCCLLKPYNTSYPLATLLSSFPYPIPPSTHHTYPSCPLCLLCSGSSFLYMLLFFCWRCSHFSVWFCIVSLSPVSRQWFYPMVGDIMLFYHRVEPRTGCWEVSASVRPSIPPLP